MNVKLTTPIPLRNFINHIFMSSFFVIYGLEVISTVVETLSET